MMKIIISFTLLLTLAVPGFCLEITGFTPDKIVTYKKIDEIELKMNIFEPENHKSSDKRPAIVFFFGGGWVNGSPSQFYPQCQYLASRGILAMSAEYRVKKKHGTSPIECVKDGKSAVRWIRKNASQLGVDPNRIAAGGGSAGGQVAAATGTLKEFEESNEEKKISSKPNALVLFNPAFDNGPGGCGYDLVKQYWKQFSPMHNIDENTPPTVVFLGTKDKLIPVSTAEKYKELMIKNGARCDLHLYKDQRHGFFNYGRNKSKYYYQTMTEADKFLASLGYLKPEPTLQKKSPRRKNRRSRRNKLHR